MRQNSKETPKFLKRTFVHIQRPTAIALSICMLLMSGPVQASEIPAAHLGMERRQSAESQIKIPGELGTVEEVWIAPSDEQEKRQDLSVKRNVRHSPLPEKTIIYIQDAHDSLEAQENIGKIIHYLVGNYGVKTVFEEGYEGRVPTDEFFTSIKDPEIKEKVSYFLMDQLRLGGAEYAHVNRFYSVLGRGSSGMNKKRIFKAQASRLMTHDPSLDFELIGADSLKLHQQNIDWYQKTARHQEETASDLREMQTALRSLANQFFSKTLKEWMRIKEKFDLGELDLLDYLKRTQRLFLKGTPLEIFQNHYPHIALLLAADKTQSPKLLEKLKAELDYKALFLEINSLEDDYADKQLGQGDGSALMTRDRQIFDNYKLLQLLTRLNRIEVTEEEYEAVTARLQNMDALKIAEFIAAHTHKAVVLPKRWEQNIRAAISFYETARQRDEAIEGSLGSWVMRRESGKEHTAQDSKLETTAPAVLVFGGFHKENIKQILREHGFSYYIVAPKITQISPRHQDYYKRLMSVGFHPFEAALGLVATALSPERVLTVGGAAQYDSAAALQPIAALAEQARTQHLPFDPQLAAQQLNNSLWNKDRSNPKSPPVQRPGGEPRRENLQHNVSTSPKTRARSEVRENITFADYFDAADDTGRLDLHIEPAADRAVQKGLRRHLTVSFENEEENRHGLLQIYQDSERKWIMALQFGSFDQGDAPDDTVEVETDVTSYPIIKYNLTTNARHRELAWQYIELLTHHWPAIREFQRRMGFWQAFLTLFEDREAELQKRVKSVKFRDLNTQAISDRLDEVVDVILTKLTEEEREWIQENEVSEDHLFNDEVEGLETPVILEVMADYFEEPEFIDEKDPALKRIRRVQEEVIFKLGGNVTTEHTETEKMTGQKASRLFKSFSGNPIRFYQAKIERQDTDGADAIKLVLLNRQRKLMTVYIYPPAEGLGVSFQIGVKDFKAGVEQEVDDRIAGLKDVLAYFSRDGIVLNELFDNRKAWEEMLGTEIVPPSWKNALRARSEVRKGEEVPLRSVVNSPTKVNWAAKFVPWGTRLFSISLIAVSWFWVLPNYLDDPLQTLNNYVPVAAIGIVISASVYVASMLFKTNYFRRFSFVVITLVSVYLGGIVLSPVLASLLPPFEAVLLGIGISMGATFVSKVLPPLYQEAKLLGSNKKAAKENRIQWKEVMDEAFRWSLGYGSVLGFYLYAVAFPFFGKYISGSIPYFKNIQDYLPVTPETASTAMLIVLADLTVATFVSAGVTVFLGAAFGKKADVSEEKGSVIKSFIEAYPIDATYWFFVLVPAWIIFGGDESAWGLKMTHGIFEAIFIGIVANILDKNFDHNDEIDQATVPPKGQPSEDTDSSGLTRSEMRRPDHQDVDTWVKKLDESDWLLRQAAIDGLLGMDNKELVINKLLEGLVTAVEPSLQYRLAAIDILGQLQASSALPYFQKALNSADKKTQLEVLMALNNFESLPRNVVSILAKKLEASVQEDKRAALDHDICKDLISILGANGLGSDEAAQALALAIFDSKRDVSYRAARALAKTGAISVDTQELIFKRLRDGGFREIHSKKVQLNIIVALGYIAMNSRRGAEAVFAFLNESQLVSQLDLNMRQSLADIVVEPLLFRLPDRFNEETLSRFASDFNDVETFKYLIAFHQTIRRERVNQGAFPYQEQVSPYLAEGSKRLLLVDDHGGGMGDDLIRNTTLIQALLARNPELKVTLYSRYPHIYDSERVEVRDVKELGGSLADQDFDAVFYYQKKLILPSDSTERVSKIIERTINAQNNLLYIRQERTVDLNDALGHSFEPYEMEVRKRGEVQLKNTFLPYAGSNVYSQKYRLLLELGVNPVPRLSGLEALPVLAEEKPEAAAYWHEHIQPQRDAGSEIEVFNGVGGDYESKGFMSNESGMKKFREKIQERLQRTPKKFIVLLSSEEAWGTPEHLRKVIEILTDDEKARVLIVPPPKEVPGLYNYIITHVDHVQTVEGGVMHFAFAAGIPFTVMPMLRGNALLPWYPLTAPHSIDWLEPPVRRSEVRTATAAALVSVITDATVLNNILNIGVEDLTVSSGVILDAGELAFIGPDDFEEELTELLILVQRNKAFHVYVDHLDRYAFANHQNPWLKALMAEPRVRQLRHRDQLKGKAILLQWSLFDQAAPGEKMVTAIQEKLGTDQQIFPVQGKAGTVTAFLKAAQSALQSASEIKTYFEASVLNRIARKTEGRWQVSEDFMLTIRSELRAAYAVAVAA